MKKIVLTLFIAMLILASGCGVHQNSSDDILIPQDGNNLEFEYLGFNHASYNLNNYEIPHGTEYQYYVVLTPITEYMSDDDKLRLFDEMLGSTIGAVILYAIENAQNYKVVIDRDWDLASEHFEFTNINSVTVAVEVNENNMLSTYEKELIFSIVRAVIPNCEFEIIITDDNMS